jgi:hypothetical protein
MTFSLSSSLSHEIIKTDNITMITEFRICFIGIDFLTGYNLLKRVALQKSYNKNKSLTPMNQALTISSI